MCSFGFECPHCGQSIQAPANAVSPSMVCPACEENIEIEKTDAVSQQQRFSQPPETPLGATTPAKGKAIHAANCFVAVIAIVLAIITCVAIMPYAVWQSYAEEYRESGAGSHRSWRNYTVRIIFSYVPFKPQNQLGVFFTEVFFTGYGVQTKQFFVRIAWEFLIPEFVLCFSGYWWFMRDYCRWRAKR